MQQDFIINGVSVVLNKNEEGFWQKDNLIFLKQDITEQEIKPIINYLFEEGIIVDRRIDYEIK